MINSIALQETHLIKLNNIQSRKKNYFNKLETELFKPKMEYLQKKNWNIHLMVRYWNPFFLRLEIC